MNTDLVKLRKLAEQKAQQNPDSIDSNQSLEKVVEELRIHQIELEMQKEELESSQVELEQSRRHFSTLFDQAPVAYVELDVDRNVIRVNLAARELFELGPDDISNRFFQKFFSDRNRQSLHEALDLVSDYKSSSRCRLEIVTGSGRNKYVEASIARILDPKFNKNMYLCGFLDFTREHKFQLALEANEKQLQAHLKERQAMFDALPAHVALVDANGVIQAVNVAWKRFGEANGLDSPNFSIGENYIEICNLAHGDCSEEAVRVARGLESVLSGEINEFNLEYPCHSPDEERWFRLTITAVTPGQHDGAVIMHVNVTKEHQMHLQALRSQRLESIGTLAGGIAHDLNNLLTPIVMGTDLIETKHLNPMEIEVLETISENARRGARMIRQLLDYARGSQGLKQKTLQPISIIQDIQKFIRESFPKNIQFTSTGETDLYQVH